MCAQPSAVDIVAGLEYVIGNILMEGIVVVAGQASSAAAPTSTLCPAVRIQGLNATIGVENITLQYSVVGTAACRVPPELPVPAAKSVRVVQQCSTTVRARCTNASNCRPELQAFLESGASSVAFGTDGTAAQDGVYTIREPGLWPKSNTAVVFEAGTMLLAARGAFVVAPLELPPDVDVGDALSMIVFKDVANISILGYNATIKMRKGDYNSQKEYNPPSSTRMGVVFRNCSSIAVKGFDVVETGGDGFYIGRNHRPTSAAGCLNQSTACHGVARKIHIADVRSLRNSRQGMSIVAGIDVLVERSEFSWTQGACPQAGIDIEPSSESEPIHNVTLKQLLIQNNTGAAVQLPVDPYAFLPGGLPLLLTLDSIHAYGANWSAHQDGCSSSGFGFLVGPYKSVGSVVIVNCTAEELPSAALLVQAKAFGSTDTKGHLGPPGQFIEAGLLNITQFSARNTALRPIVLNNVTESPLILAAQASASMNWTLGGIVLNNVLVAGDTTFRRPWISIAELGPYSIEAAATNISGTATVQTPNECALGISKEALAGVDVSVHCSNSGNPASLNKRWVEGVLDDAAFPPEEQHILSSILYPKVLTIGPGDVALLQEPGTGALYNRSVGETCIDWTLVAFVPSDDGSKLAVFERRFARFGVFVYASAKSSPSPSAPAPMPTLLLRKSVGTLEAVQYQARQFYAPAYYTTIALSKADLVGDMLVNDAECAHRDVAFADVLPYLTPMSEYVTLGAAPDAHARRNTAKMATSNDDDGVAGGRLFTVCPDGVIKAANGTLREPSAKGAPGIVVFDPGAYVSGGNRFTDAVAGLVGEHLPVASYGYSDSASGRAWEIIAFVDTGSSMQHQPLIVRLAELGGVVRYFRAGVGSKPTELPQTTATAALFFAALKALHASFDELVGRAAATSVTLPADERRLQTMAKAGIVQSLATYNELDQQYGTGIDYYSNTKELMTVASSINSALLLWNIDGGYAAMDRLQKYLVEYIDPDTGAFRIHTATCGSNWIPDAVSDFGELLAVIVHVSELPLSGAATFAANVTSIVAAVVRHLLAIPRGNCPGISCGLVYGPPEHDTCADRDYYYHNSVWTARGLADASRLLSSAATDAVGAAHEDHDANGASRHALQTLSKAAALGAASLDQAVETSMRLLRVPAANGLPAFIPPAANASMKAFMNMSDGMLASYSSFRYFAESVASRHMPDDLAREMLAWKSTQGGVLLGLTTIETDPWNTPGLVYPWKRHIDQYPAGFYARALLDLDFVPQYILMLRAHTAHACSRATFGAVEQVSILGNGSSRALLPFDTNPSFSNPGGIQERDVDANLPATVLVARMLRWMLVDDQAAANGWPPHQQSTSGASPRLWIGRATPRSWLSAASAAVGASSSAGWSILNCSTRFGRLDVNMSVDGAGTARMDLDLRVAPSLPFTLSSSSAAAYSLDAKTGIVAVRFRMPSAQTIPPLAHIKVIGAQLLKVEANDTLVLELSDFKRGQTNPQHLKVAVAMQTMTPLHASPPLFGHASSSSSSSSNVKTAKRWCSSRIYDDCVRCEKVRCKGGRRGARYGSGSSRC